MLVFEHIDSLKKHLDSLKKSGKSIGFVPTMGALHAGHISLIQKAKAENEVVVCSVFVNPTQFNNKADLEKYPRPIENDKRMLEEASCDVLFNPSAAEMYPEASSKFKVQSSKFYQPTTNNPALPAGKQQLETLNFKLLDKVMEGAHRPGHFKGVVQVVSLLFDIVEPARAYFGQKDFQQLAIIQEMVRQLNYPIQIVPCPIIREPNGLAMSSRNTRLSSSQREKAALIYKTLKQTEELVESKSITELKQLVINTFEKNPEFKLEYFELVNSISLEPLISAKDAPYITACIAVWLGDVRLIDNITLR